MQLAREGFLDRLNVRLLGSSPKTIDRAEDRQLFKETMQQIGQPVVPRSLPPVLMPHLSFAGETITRSLSGRPLRWAAAGAYCPKPGGALEIARVVWPCPHSPDPCGEIVAGWKEIEFEVMRDRAGNAITVCSMENFDPVGVHTGDSIVIAPAVTLSDKSIKCCARRHWT